MSQDGRIDSGTLQSYFKVNVDDNGTNPSSTNQSNPAASQSADSGVGTAPGAEARPSNDNDSPEADARQKLAVEALMADPAQMRKVFADLQEKISPDGTGNIGWNAITAGINDSRMTQQERDLLFILKDDYSALSTIDGGNSNAGISADEMTILNKALNRNLKEDPIYAENAKLHLVLGPVFGMPLGAIAGGLCFGPPGIIAGAVIGGVVMAGVDEAQDYLKKLPGADYDKQYDKVKADYQGFENKEKNAPADNFHTTIDLSPYPYYKEGLP